MNATLRANPRWLLAESGGGLVLVGSAADIEVAVEGPPEHARRLCELLAQGADAPSVARVMGCEIAEATVLLDELAGCGALVAEPEPEPDLGWSLGVALYTSQPPTLVWTAEEALLLPDGIDAALAREALDRFACGLTHSPRLIAYADQLRAGRRTTWGDAPDAATLAHAVVQARAAAAEDIHVLDLAAAAEQQAPSKARLAVRELIGLGAQAPHRLGAILTTTDLGTQDGQALVSAYRAVPSLRSVGHPDARYSRGSAVTRERADLLARAEAAERYALEDPGASELKRAKLSELDGAIAPAALLAYSARQLATHGAASREEDPELMWAPMRTTNGGLRWAPAGAVLLGVDGPGGVAMSGSGAAAHTATAPARERAVAELIERDAFMLTWVRGLSRELIERRSLPQTLADRMSALEAHGVCAALVNLSLDSWPVVLCVLHGESRLALGAACRPRAEAAATAAVNEAAGVLRLAASQNPAPLAPEAVRTPLEHFRLHQDAGRICADAFLWSSDERVSLAELPEPVEDIAALLAPVGELCFAELSVPRLAPFVVVRALVPGLVPITFGHDQEPLGLPRLNGPLRTLHCLFESCTTADEAAIVPHPFP